MLLKFPHLRRPLALLQFWAEHSLRPKEDSPGWAAEVQAPGRMALAAAEPPEDPELREAVDKSEPVFRWGRAYPSLTWPLTPFISPAAAAVLCCASGVVQWAWCGCGVHCSKGCKLCLDDAYVGELQMTAGPFNHGHLACSAGRMLSSTCCCLEGKATGKNCCCCSSR